MSTWQILEGDCLAVLPTLAENSVDAVVTDPPYHLTQASRGGSPRQNDPETPFGRTRLGSAGFMGNTWDGGDVAFRPEIWAAVARVLRPGGHLLAMGGSRTWHRLACAIEDAGFEIRDSLAWVYSTGMPKHRSATLKPSFEPVVMARKALDLDQETGRSTIDLNVAKWGTGALQIDACRVRWKSNGDADEAERKNQHADCGTGRANNVYGADGRAVNYKAPPGRFPPNVLLCHTPECRQVGTVRIMSSQFNGAPGPGPQPNVFGRRQTGPRVACPYAPDGRETVEEWDCSPECPVAEIDRQGERWSGAASRFYPRFCYEPKHRTAHSEGIEHECVKPVALMRWLCRLVCPPGGLVCDPFAGSGSTGVAAIAEELRFVGIEREPAYAELARRRLAEATAQQVLPLGASSER